MDGCGSMMMMIMMMMGVLAGAGGGIGRGWEPCTRPMQQSYGPEDTGLKLSDADRFFWMGGVSRQGEEDRERHATDAEPARQATMH